MKRILDDILRDSAKYIDGSVVASYIPELAKVNKYEFGICAVTPRESAFAPVIRINFSQCKVWQSL
jgi:glutaminase